MVPAHIVTFGSFFLSLYFFSILTLVLFVKNSAAIIWYELDIEAESI